MTSYDKYLAILDFVPKSDYFRYLLEDLSPGQVAHIMSEAIEEENFELCLLCQQVQSNYASLFKVYFLPFDDVQSYLAEIVPFQKDGKTFYHADTFINGTEDGQQIMLFRDEKGRWASEKRGFKAELSTAIGKAIDHYTKRFFYSQGLPSIPPGAGISPACSSWPGLGLEQLQGAIPPHQDDR